MQETGKVTRQVPNRMLPSSLLEGGRAATFPQLMDLLGVNIPTFQMDLIMGCGEGGGSWQLGSARLPESVK